MEVAGLCSICGRPGAMHTCSSCGAHVCVEHYDPRYSMCVPCATRRGIGVR